MDFFGDTAAILNSIVWNSYYGMLGGKYILICTLSNRIQNGRRTAEKVHWVVQEENEPFIVLRHISNTKDRVLPHFKAPRVENTTRSGVFWWTSRCSEMWSDMVLNAWYILSI